MASPSADHTHGLADQSPSAKPSLRTRLFSNLSRTTGNSLKPQEKELESEEKTIPEVEHTAENSASTSSTLAAEPPGSSEDRQAPPAVHSPPSGEPLPPSVTRVQDTQVDDMDRERGSLNTTLIGHHNRRVPFYRRKMNKSSTSQAAVSSTTSHSIVKPRSRRVRSKPSFMSRVVYKVVPCVGPDPRILSDNLDDTASDQRPSLALKDLSGVRKSESDQRQSSEFPVATNIALLNIPPISVSRPPSIAESEVIVPPPPSSHLLPEDETDGVTSGAVQPPGSTGDLIVRTHTRDSDSEGTSYTDDEVDRHTMDEQAEEERLIRNGGAGLRLGPDGVPRPLLPPIAPQHIGRKCLVLDLDETLVHSSFKPIPQPDFIVPVEIEFHWHHFHVLTRPGVHEFLKKMGELYEIVVFTASLSKYADPVLDKLDIHQSVAHRLYRESCFSHRGNYVKDLSQLGRPISDTIILDNSPASYVFHPHNAVPVSSWFNDPHDAELMDLVPFLADLTSVPDVRGILNLAT